MKLSDHETKKEVILEVARELGAERFSPAEVEQIRRQIVVRLGPSGKTSPEYIAEVLEDAGLRVVWSTEADTQGLYEEEFRDLLALCHSGRGGDVPGPAGRTVAEISC